MNGLSHISVFIAGAARSGREKSHARTTHVRRLSQSPFAAFASVLAESGASRSTSAHLRSSMWRTGSSRLFQQLHSFSSVRT